MSSREIGMVTSLEPPRNSSERGNSAKPPRETGITFLPDFEVDIKGLIFRLPGVGRHLLIRQEILRMMLEKHDENADTHGMTRDEIRDELKKRGLTAYKPDLAGTSSCVDIGISIKGKKLVAHKKEEGISRFFVNQAFFDELNTPKTNLRMVGPRGVRPRIKEPIGEEPTRLHGDSFKAKSSPTLKNPTVLEQAAKKELKRTGRSNDLDTSRRTTKRYSLPLSPPRDFDGISDDRTEISFSADAKYWDRRIRVQQNREAPLGQIFGDSALAEDGLSPSIAERICDTAATGTIEAVDSTVEVAQIWKQLSPGERYILRKRYGLEGERGRSLEKIGEEFGVTREAIRQVEEKIFKKLRSTL